LVTIKQAPNEELSIANLSRVLRMIYEKTVEAEGFPLHAAMIVKNNKAFLLSARRGTGKTTCCNRIPSPWNVICDDKTLIVKTSDNKYRVHPLPTQSNFYKNKLPKKWNIQKSYQLEAVYFIEQAVKDEVVPIWQGEAAKLLYHQIKIIHSANPKNFTHKEMEKMRNYNKSVFNNACTLTQNVPCNVLRVSLHGKFWEKIRKRSRNIPSCSAN
ncbi:MAG: SynChlorMet cassette protein ScmC, partial [Candidatus Saganbacteria bacterium]|nr:SynChlorMet cassette protein ScmC [Candidatus Saganbacteria bacterium]